MKTALALDENNLFSFNLLDIADHDKVIIHGREEVLAAVNNTGFPRDLRFELKTEAYLLQLAYKNNKLLSLSNSRTQIIAHQIECAHRIVNALNQRFLIADEVGLGKTIEAGFVIKELMFRFEYKRILIICPASLSLQWQSEMKNKFNEDFTVLDRAILKRKSRDPLGSYNPWRSFDRAICSIDFIKNKSFSNDLKNARWDAIIFDEAHRLRRDSQHSTLAYSVAEILSATTNCLLFLTATPFRGKLEELYYLIRLLDKNLLGPYQTFFNNFCMHNADLRPLKEKVSTILIRRTKKEVGGFTSRFARTIRFELYPGERLLYDETTRYVIEEYNKALSTENRAVGFVMIAFQKLLDSSSFALLSALNNRKGYLQAIVKEGADSQRIHKSIKRTIDLDITDDMDQFSSILFKATLKKTIDELKDEIRTIDRLISLAESVSRNKKGEKLKEIVAKLRKKEKNCKILIFTQFRMTQNYLADILSDCRVEIFNGSMDRDQKEAALLNFREKSDILISTEAGGEGRNIQFCNILINYDLPWSPLKIEQRIGRIHRFGQKKDVFIYNFSTKDTVAERVLAVLNNKLKLFEESIGTPDIMLGQIEEELNLNSLFMEMISGKKSQKKVYAEVDNRIEIARKSYEKLSDLAISNQMDFNYDEYYRVTLKDRTYSNRRIENFINALQGVTDYTENFIGKKHKISRLYPVIGNSSQDKSRIRYGTFNSQRAIANDSLEFLAFGNPVVEELISHCKDDEFGGLSGCRILKYKKPFAAMIVNYLVTFSSMKDFQEMIPVCIDPYKNLTENEIEEIEALSLEDAGFYNYKIMHYNSYEEKISNASEKLFNDADRVIIKKVESRIKDIHRNMNPKLFSEIHKIKDYYAREIKELEEQLERQYCQMKWFDKDMKSAISRTKNNITAKQRELYSLLSKHEGYMNTQYSIRMLNAGILIGKGD